MATCGEGIMVVESIFEMVSNNSAISEWVANKTYGLSWKLSQGGLSHLFVELENICESWVLEKWTQNWTLNCASEPKVSLDFSNWWGIKRPKFITNFRDE